MLVPIVLVIQIHTSTIMVTHAEKKDVFPTPMRIPVFNDVTKHRKWLLEQMAGAFRVFARKGYNQSIAGHISVRDPEDPTKFWLNPLGYPFDLLKASDMVLVDHEGNIVGGSMLPVNKAGFQIHSHVHAARPDVIVACHTHSTYGKAYSAFGKPLEMLNQDVCVFYDNHSVYTNFGGIVLSGDEGEQIAKAIGNNSAVILQNHGLLTCGRTVGEAAMLYTTLERSCEVQLLADSSKYPKKLIPDDEAKHTRDAQLYPDLLYFAFTPDLRYEEHVDPSFKD